MAFCPHCGATVADAASFCAACGRSVTPQAGPPSAPTGLPAVHAPATPTPLGGGATPVATTARPIGVTIVAVVYFVLSAFVAVAGLVVLLGGSFIASQIQETEGFGAILGAAAGLIGILFLGLAALGILVGVGLLKGKQWAWWTVLVFEVLAVLNGIVSIAQRDFNSLFGILVAAIIIWYFLRPEVRAFFGRS